MKLAMMFPAFAKQTSVAEAFSIANLKKCSYRTRLEIKMLKVYEGYNLYVPIIIKKKFKANAYLLAIFLAMEK